MSGASDAAWTSAGCHENKTKTLISVESSRKEQSKGAVERNSGKPLDDLSGWSIAHRSVAHAVSRPLRGYELGDHKEEIAQFVLWEDGAEWLYGTADSRESSLSVEAKKVLIEEALIEEALIDEWKDLQVESKLRKLIS